MDHVNDIDYKIKPIDCLNDNKTNGNLFETSNESNFEHSHVCQICSKVFSTLSRLSSHIKIEHEWKKFQCNDCKKSFMEVTQLTKHLLIHQKDRFKCMECNKVFNWSSNLRVHMRLHNKEKPYQCEICSRSFSQPHHLKAHRGIHESCDESCICKICNKTFSHNYLLKVHLSKHDRDLVHNCEYCGQIFTTSYLLRNHVKIHMLDSQGSVTFKCDYCDKRFKRKHYLKTHINIHTGNRPFECEFCNKRFSVSSNLKQHINVIHTLSKYKCNICDKAMASDTKLQLHIMSHENEKIDSFQKCELCNKSFKNIIMLNMHMNIVHNKLGEGMKSGSILEKNINSYSNDNLSKHELTSFKCSICDKTMNSHWKLIKHMIIHDPKNRIFKCEICEKSFYRKFTLKIHMDSHLGNRPYKCLSCEASFTVASNLKVHMQRHESQFIQSYLDNKKIVKCDLCKQDFNDYNVYLNHCISHNEVNNISAENNGILSVIPKLEENLEICKFKCQKCFNFFSNLSDLIQHSKVHFPKDKTLLCNICDKIFYENVSLQRHMLSHNKIKPFKCGFCDASFLAISSLKFHVYNIHNFIQPICYKKMYSKKINKFNCKYCTKNFSNASNYWIHLFSHKNYRIDFDQQQKSEFNENELNTKESIENVESTNYKTINIIDKLKKSQNKICSICNKFFKKKSGLLDHLRTHTGERPFKCDSCDRAFAALSNLKKHKINMHSTLSQVISSEIQMDLVHLQSKQGSLLENKQINKIKVGNKMKEPHYKKNLYNFKLMEKSCLNEIDDDQSNSQKINVKIEIDNFLSTNSDHIGQIILNDIS